jgi:Tol biopolymer transport system component
VKRCLAKDRDQRLQTAWDLLSQLKWIAEGGSQVGLAAPLSALRRKQSRLARLALTMAAGILILVSVPAALSLRNNSALVENRFLIDVPDMPTAEAVSISPDGRLVAYSARDGATTSIFVRPIAVELPQRLPGTEGAGRLFWAPDNRTIGFFANGKLKRVEADGGHPQTICDTPDMQGGSWNVENTIIFASSGGLMRVTAAGGQPTMLPKTEGRTEPLFLPDGRHYLFLSNSGKPDAAIFAGSIDSADATQITVAQSNAAYADPGYLFYHRKGTLYAQAFNAKRMSLSGEPLRIAEGLPYGNGSAAAFAASQTGVLIFRNEPPAEVASGTPGTGLPEAQAPLIWVDRKGKSVQEVGENSVWAGVDLSPDGKRSAVHRHESGGGDIWIFEAGVTAPSKFTFDASQDNSSPAWSPDGTRIAFGSKRNGKNGLYLKLADNTRNEELLLESDVPAVPMGWSPDGKLLVYSIRDPKNGGDIFAVAVADPKKPIPILQTAADERNPQVSPDGKWIAYSSNESGRSEIYIRSFPEGPARIQVSVNGGVFPRWRRDGKELYFLNPVSLGNMMATNIRVSGSSVQRDVPRVLFQSQFVTGIHAAGPYHAYAVAGNGERFLINQFETLQALYASGVVARGRNATLAGVINGIITDRHSSGPAVSGSSAPITVVLHWTGALQQ